MGNNRKLSGNVRLPSANTRREFSGTQYGHARPVHGKSPKLPGVPNDLYIAAVPKHLATVRQMHRIPASLHEYVVKFFESHSERIATAQEVARHYESSARSLEIHGDERALRTLHLELRVCELLAGRPDVSYIGLREDVQGQEMDVIVTIAGVTYYFEAKTGSTDTAQKQRLTRIAKQTDAGLLYVDGLVGAANRHFSARHLEAMIELPTETFLLNLEKWAVVKPNSQRVALVNEEKELSPQGQSPAFATIKPLTATHRPAPRPKSIPTITPRALAVQAYRQARSFIKDSQLRDNMATLDSWLSRLAYEKLTYLWNQIAEDPTRAEERLQKINDCERATWLAARPDLLEERLEALLGDEHVESFLLRQSLGFEPADHTQFKASVIELTNKAGTQQLILERRSPQEALTLLKSQNYPDDISRYLGHPEVRDVILARDLDGTILAYLAANLEGSRQPSNNAPIRFIRAHKIDQDRQKNIKGLFFGMTAYVLDRLQPQWMDLPADAPCIGGILLKIMDRFREREFDGERSPVKPSNIDPFFYDEDLPLAVIPVAEAKFIHALFKLDAQPLP